MDSLSILRPPNETPSLSVDNYEDINHVTPDPAAPNPLIEQVPGVQNYLLRNGELDYTVLLRGLYWAACTHNSARLCDNLVKIVQCLHQMGIFTLPANSPKKDHAKRGSTWRGNKPRYSKRIDSPVAQSSRYAKARQRPAADDSSDLLNLPTRDSRRGSVATVNMFLSSYNRSNHSSASDNPKKNEDLPAENTEDSSDGASEASCSDGGGTAGNLLRGLKAGFKRKSQSTLETPKLSTLMGRNKGGRRNTSVVGMSPVRCFRIAAGAVDHPRKYSQTPVELPQTPHPVDKKFVENNFVIALQVLTKTVWSLGCPHGHMNCQGYKDRDSSMAEDVPVASSQSVGFDVFGADESQPQVRF
ncbi:Protein unc-80 [Cichlidogyrus casuarinus]|uniref:Protein unc-80 n=1 Tax=Cichlidogyrus casuarinus TaxID=1844966 RepID=A0ABD2QEJ3_9PLAT